MEKLSILEQKHDSFVLLELVGILDFQTYTEFHKRVYTHIATTNIVVDLSRVNNITSIGLGVLMYGIEEGRQRGNRMYLLNPSDIVRLAIESTGFDDLFSIIKTIKDIG
jgi:anti-anti-sigma factor